MVIGAGCIGAAVARELAKTQASVLVLEAAVLGAVAVAAAAVMMIAVAAAARALCRC